MMDISLHGVTKITSNKIHAGANYIARTLTIKFGKDEELEISLFADEPLSLVIKKEQ